MLDADVMEERLWDSPIEDNTVIDSDDTKELGKGEDIDGDIVNPEDSESRFDGEDGG